MAKYVKTEQGYKEPMELVDSRFDSKMNKNNPFGTGSFSMGRKAGSVVGDKSHAEGNDTTASGRNSHAEGYMTTASGESSHAECDGTTASGESSHAEGYNTTASGESSHAECDGTTASGNYSHAEGSNTTASGAGSHAEGLFTKASKDYQHAQGKYNIEDSAGIYADIIGNGTDDASRSNAATVDWNGNAWYAGDVYVGSTSGTNKDAGSKKLATEKYASALGITNATVGQIARITAVDSDGKPTAWEPVDMPSGEKWELINEITIADDAEESNAISFTKDINGNDFALKKAMILAHFPTYTGSSTIPINTMASINNSTGTSLAYTSAWVLPSASKDTAMAYFVDISTPIQIEKRIYIDTVLIKSGGWRYFNKWSVIPKEWCAVPSQIESITEIGGKSKMLIYPKCWFALYGVRV